MERRSNKHIKSPATLANELIEELPLEKGDTKGDLYEYLLGKLTTAGINGQFRTPRHIIRMMVELVDPEPQWTIADPACGSRRRLSRSTSGSSVTWRELLSTGNLWPAAARNSVTTTSLCSRIPTVGRSST